MQTSKQNLPIKFATPPVLFVTGIDTDAGKTFASAWLMRKLLAAGVSAITQKFIQTGCENQSEDIEAHRKLCGIDLTDFDRAGVTAPIIFPYPASAQLAARLADRKIDLSLIDNSTSILSQHFNTVIIEGAGGLMVPITDTCFTIDYIASRNIPVALVTNSRLGSINHTILALEAIAARKIPLHSLIYNAHFDKIDPLIASDTKGFLKRYLHTYFPGVPFITVPSMRAPRKRNIPAGDPLLTPYTKPTAPAESPDFKISISKDQLKNMPTISYTDKITLVDTEAKLSAAIAELRKSKVVGFDTETKPSFKKGVSNNVALMQIYNGERCYLIRINKTGLTDELIDWLSDPSLIKVGLSLKDDFHQLHKRREFNPHGFVELQIMVRDFGINDASLQKIYGIVFGKRISKSQRLTNWEAPELTPAQQRYAALDAKACLEIYTALESGSFNPQKSPYIVTDEENPAE